MSAGVLNNRLSGNNVRISNLRLGSERAVENVGRLDACCNHCWNSACQPVEISLTETLIDRVGLFRQAAKLPASVPQTETIFPRPVGAGFPISSVYLSLWTKRDLRAHGNRVRTRVINISTSFPWQIYRLDFPSDFSTNGVSTRD